MKRTTALVFFVAVILSACGGGGGSPGVCQGSTEICFPPEPVEIEEFPPSPTLARQCKAPRPEGAMDPEGRLYGDVQGLLATEKAWIRSYVNETYLWYDEVPLVDPSLYVIGATVPYVDPSSNAQMAVTLNTNYDVVDAYFNSQRSLALTDSGKPKDQFHFTYPTADWVALSTSGNVAGFGFQVALLAAAPPRKALVAYTAPATPA